MSKIGLIYEKIYSFVCGRHPDYYPWHFQWLFLRDVDKWQKEIFVNISGNVIDLGCGTKPYDKYFDHSKVNYIGLDVFAGEKVDVVIGEKGSWPIATDSIDCVISTQVFEHVKGLENTLIETNRVLKAGGILLVTMPFMFPSHGLPSDYRRLTINGLRELFQENYINLEVVPKGKFGTVSISLLLTWIENSLNIFFIGRILKGILLPVWILFSFVMNVFGLIIDKVDYTNTHYANVCLYALKK